MTMKAEYKGVALEGTPEEIATVLKAAGIVEEIERSKIRTELTPMPTWKPYEVMLGGVTVTYQNRDASPPHVPSFAGQYSP